jgi:hypothetical protein
MSWNTLIQRRPVTNTPTLVMVTCNHATIVERSSRAALANYLTQHIATRRRCLLTPLPDDDANALMGALPVEQVL